jgi:hypothetical protein
VAERGPTVRAAVAIGFGAFTLLTWSARAWYGRWIADDYCFAILGWRDGFWHGQALMYARLNGRISVSFLMAVITSLGRGTIPALALVTMIVWLIGAWRAAHYAFAMMQARVSTIEEIAGALVFVAAIISVAPDSDQPLIWLLGLVTYGMPIVCATWMAALVLRCAATDRAPSALVVGAVVALAFVAGGCSEVAAAAQLIDLLMLMPFVKRVRPLMIAGAVASAVALLIAALSSGNAVRRALFAPLPIPAAAMSALADAPLTLAALMVQGLAPFAVLIIFFALAGERTKRTPAALAIAAIVASLPIMTATLFGGLYGTGHLPWGRVQFVPVAYATSAILFAAFALPRPRLPSVAIGLTAAMVLLAAVEVVSTASVRVRAIGEARQFAAIADEIDALARKQRGAALVVRAPREYELLEFLSPDPDHWTNRCMAGYYGLTSIRTPLPSRR